MSNIERAVAYFDKGFNCAQSVCTAFAEQLGVDRETALKISSGFGGGMGRMAGTCGAVTGAFMALGIKYGPSQPSPEAKAKMYERIREFAERFTARHNALECRELLGYDMSIAEEREKIKAEKLTSDICPQIIRDTAEILEEMMQGGA